MDWSPPQSISTPYIPNSEPPTAATKPVSVVVKRRGPELQPRQGPCPRPTKQYKFGNDALGKLVESSVALLSKLSSWQQYVASIRGPSHISPTVEQLQHPAAPLLVRLRTRGMPVVVRTPGWSPPLVQDLLGRGPHQSANDHLEFVRDEMADFVRKGFWTVLPYPLVKRLRGLHLSPLSSIPQRGRRPILIVDLSFYGVNMDTVKLAPHEAMQFGRALDRLLFRIRHADPRHGPVYMNKIDISDGFYRVWLAANSTPKLAVILPVCAAPPFGNVRRYAPSR